MKFFSIIVLAFGTSAVVADSTPWSYEGALGPDAWGTLNMGSTNNECGLSAQSPIDIDVSGTKYDSNLKPLNLKDYNKVVSNVTIQNNGHAVQLDAPTWPQSMTGGPLDGTYNMLQMHFHWGKDSYRGSEHTVNGKRYPIELHMVHKSTDKNALAVIGVFFDVTKGESAPAIKQIAEAIKDMKTHAHTNFPGSLSPDMLLPQSKDFFTYQGSLTTPPCAEIVTWIVLREPLKISEKDLQAFRSTLFEDSKPMVDNFRPVQALNNRQVRSSFPTGGSSSASTMISSLPLMILSALLCNY